MKKRAGFAAMLLALSAAMSTTAFAAGWEEVTIYGRFQDGSNQSWVYSNEAGVYYRSLQWVDGNGDGIAERYDFSRSREDCGTGLAVRRNEKWKKWSNDSSGEYSFNDDGQLELNGKLLTMEMEKYNQRFSLANPTSEQIVHDLTDFTLPYESTDYFLIDETRPEVESGLTNIYFNPKYAMYYDRYGGWYAIPVDYPGAVATVDFPYVFVAVKPLDAPDKVFKHYNDAIEDYNARPYTEAEEARKQYIYRNTTTPDGYYVNQYGLMTKDGKVVVHEGYCHMSSSWGTGYIGTHDIGWIHPFGTQPFEHYIGDGVTPEYAFGDCVGLPEAECFRMK